MKATIGLIIAFLIFLVVGSVVALLTGPFDIYILLSLIFVPVLIVLLAFCLKRRLWAYMGSMVVGMFVVVATAASLGEKMPPFLMWETFLATVLGILMALEGFKAYSESKS